MDRLLAVAFIIAINATLGWQGVIGCFAAGVFFHVAYRCKEGHWFGD